LAVCLVASAMSLTQAEFGRRYYSKEAREAIAALPGCITADDPGTLVQLDVLSRNLQRGCPLSLDLGGYSYDFNPSASVGVQRERDERWQRHALDYLASGSATMVTRYSTSFGFSEATWETIQSWPVLATDGRYKLRQPLPR